MPFFQNQSPSADRGNSLQQGGHRFAVAPREAYRRQDGTFHRLV